MYTNASKMGGDPVFCAPIDPYRREDRGAVYTLIRDDLEGSRVETMKRESTLLNDHSLVEQTWKNRNRWKRSNWRIVVVHVERRIRRKRDSW